MCVGQLAAKLQTFKVGGLKKILPPDPSPTTREQPRFDSQTIGSSSNLKACNFAASQSTETHSTSLERSQPLLQTQVQLRGLK